MSTKNSTLNSEELRDLALEEEHHDMPVEDMDDIMDSVFGTEPGTYDLDGSFDDYLSDCD